MKRRLFLTLVLGMLAVGLWLRSRETENEKIARWARGWHGPFQDRDSIRWPRRQYPFAMLFRAGRCR